MAKWRPTVLDRRRYYANPKAAWLCRKCNHIYTKRIPNCPDCKAANQRKKLVEKWVLANCQESVGV